MIDKRANADPYIKNPSILEANRLKKMNTKVRTKYDLPVADYPGPEGFRMSDIEEKLSEEEFEHFGRFFYGQTAGLDTASGEVVVYQHDFERWIEIHETGREEHWWEWD